jgi:hypothetical protein
MSKEATAPLVSSKETRTDSADSDTTAPAMTALTVGETGGGGGSGAEGLGGGGSGAGAPGGSGGSGPNAIDSLFTLLNKAIKELRKESFYPEYKIKNAICRISYKDIKNFVEMEKTKEKDSALRNLNEIMLNQQIALNIKIVFLYILKDSIDFDDIKILTNNLEIKIQGHIPTRPAKADTPNQSIKLWTSIKKELERILNHYGKGGIEEALAISFARVCNKILEAMPAKEHTADEDATAEHVAYERYAERAAAERAAAERAAATAKIESQASTNPRISVVNPFILAKEAAEKRAALAQRADTTIIKRAASVNKKVATKEAVKIVYEKFGACLKELESDAQIEEIIKHRGRIILNNKILKILAQDIQSKTYSNFQIALEEMALKNSCTSKKFYILFLYLYKESIDLNTIRHLMTALKGKSNIKVTIIKLLASISRSMESGKSIDEILKEAFFEIKNGLKHHKTDRPSPDECLDLDTGSDSLDHEAEDEEVPYTGGGSSAGPAKATTHWESNSKKRLLEEDLYPYAGGGSSAGFAAPGIELDPEKKKQRAEVSKEVPNTEDDVDIEDSKRIFSFWASYEPEASTSYYYPEGEGYEDQSTWAARVGGNSTARVAATTWAVRTTTSSTKGLGHA